MRREITSDVISPPGVAPVRLAVVLLAACSTPTPPPGTPTPAPARDAAPPDDNVRKPFIIDTVIEVTYEPEPGFSKRVVADFERAVLDSQQAYAALFDYAAVGEYEILLHRYDLNGWVPDLTDAEKQQFAAEDGTPYPAARERKNVGAFYPILAQRTVGKGGCTEGPPRTEYAEHLYRELGPLPAGTPPKYETLREHVRAWQANGGVVSFTCTGGIGGLTLVYTKREQPRGYDLVTIYDDSP